MALALLWPALALVYLRKWPMALVLVGLETAFALAFMGFAYLGPPTIGRMWIAFAVFAVAIVCELGLRAACWILATKVFADPQTVLPGRSWYRSTWFAAILLVATGQIPFLISPGWRSFNISAESNMPTLLVGDLIEAETRPGTKVGRGDVVLFRAHGETFIKRVIGLPGEHLRLTQGVVSIDGVPTVRSDPSPYPVGNGIIATRYIETLPGTAPHAILSMNDSADAENTGEFTVPADFCFVLGDNRDNSVDSRFSTLGFISAQAVVGRAWTVWWSQNHARVMMHID